MARALYDPGTNISMVNMNFVKKINKKTDIIKEFTCSSVGGVKLLKGTTLLDMKIFNI